MNKEKIALIDGDIVAHRCAWTAENENERIAIARTAELMDRILNSVETAQYNVYLSGSENFRRIVYPEYKRNRDDKPRPRHLDPIRTFLVREWGAEVTGGYEADDGIGIAHGTSTTGDGKGPTPIICSIDKDFRQLPGLHYNFVKDIYEDVSSEDAALAFWSHMLIGDTSDNVRGVDGIGPVKARRALEALDPSEMEDCVRKLFSDDERFDLTRLLLTLLTSEQQWIEIETQIREGKRPKAPAGRP